MAVYAGIDYSMSCPAITIGSSTDFDKCKTFFYIDKAKLEGAHPHSIFGMKTLPYECDMERYGNIARWAMSIMKKFKVSGACIEGYSMGSKGNVFNIGENTGILKHMMWEGGIKYHIVPPTSIKLHFAGKGNANKDVMHEAFVKQTGISIADVMKSKSTSGSPVSDIVDSYAILRYGIEHYF